jgi:hypothetical protein
MLILLFEDEQRLHPFIRYLFDTHGIISVAHWDEAGGVRLFRRFPLDEALKEIFLNRVGVPRCWSKKDSAKIIKLRSIAEDY